MKVIVAACFALLALSQQGCAPFFASHEREVDTRTVETRQGPIQLAVKESGQGRPVILLHGLGTSGYTWRHIAPGLARSHRVISIDLRGFGASEKPFDENYSIFDQADIVEAFIRQEGLQGVTVVGHSYGGGVTLALAIKLEKQDPGRLDSVILVDSLAYRQPMPIFFQVLRTPVISEIGMTVVPPEVQAAQALKIAYHNREKITDQSVYEYASPLYSPAAKHALRQTVDKLMPENIDAFVAQYKTMRLPTLLIWCDNDKIVPVNFGKRLNEDLPNAQLTVLSFCGHLPQEEKPSETLAAMQDFLLTRAMAKEGKKP